MTSKTMTVIAAIALIVPTLTACQADPGGEDGTNAAREGGSSQFERCKALFEEYKGGRIVGGEPARPGSAPWQIAIMSSPEYSDAEQSFDRTLRDGHECKKYLEERHGHELAHKCGGSYIGDGWIVTAAHCVNRGTSPTGGAGSVVDFRHIILGTQNLASAEDKFAIQSVVIHGNYSADAKMDDIALIKLSDDPETTARLSKLTEEGRLQAIEIMRPGDRDFDEMEDLRVTGWGYMGRRDDGDDFHALEDSEGQIQRKPAELQQLTINYLKDEQCRQQYDDFGDGSLCAGAIISGDEVGEGKDACQGDSGGPLTRAEDGDKRKLVGIVSRGRGCGSKGMPAVYVRASHYYDWIEQAKRAARPGKVERWPDPS